MRIVIWIVTTIMLMSTLSTSPAFADEAAIARAIANDSRTDAHRERDARSKPEVILGLLDLQAGQTVADICGGSGYYAELMAGVVGTDGEVILHNNTPYWKFVEKQITARFIDNQVPAVTLLKSEADDLKLGSGSLDAVLMVMSYHDFFVHNPESGFERTDMPLFYSQLHAALKPGGRLVIVDHAAVDGSGSSAAQDIHRIEEAYTKQEIESSGFRLVTSSDALRNPDDDRSKMVFDKSIRGKTDRFVLLFERE